MGCFDCLLFRFMSMQVVGLMRDWHCPQTRILAGARQHRERDAHLSLHFPCPS